jgi:hypothetical protein
MNRLLSSSWQNIIARAAEQEFLGPLLGNVIKEKSVINCNVWTMDSEIILRGRLSDWGDDRISLA